MTSNKRPQQRLQQQQRKKRKQKDIDLDDDIVLIDYEESDEEEREEGGADSEEVEDDSEEDAEDEEFALGYVETSQNKTQTRKGKTTTNKNGEVKKRGLPYPCEVSGCSRAYVSPQSLKRHFQRHHMNSSIACDKCGRVFGDKGLLGRHRKKHNSKPFGCEFVGCEKSFSFKKELTAHVASTHTKQRTLIVSICCFFCVDYQLTLWSSGEFQGDYRDKGKWKEVTRFVVRSSVDRRININRAYHSYLW